MATPYAVRAWRGWIARTRKGWRGLVILSIATPAFFLLAMGSGVGSIMSAESGRLLDGVPYRDFVAPGLLAASAMQLAVGEAMWQVMGAKKWERAYFAMLTTPLRVRDVFHGHLLFIASRILLGASGFALVSLVINRGRGVGIVLAVPAAILTAMSLAAPVAAWAITRQRESGFAVVQRVGLVPMFLFSGAFFPLSVLPAPLDTIAWLTPLAHGVALCRGLALGDLALTSAVVHVAYLGGLLAVGVVLGRRTFAKALRT